MARVYLLEAIKNRLSELPKNDYAIVRVTLETKFFKLTTCKSNLWVIKPI
jgi:hypothetical protein